MKATVHSINASLMLQILCNWTVFPDRSKILRCKSKGRISVASTAVKQLMDMWTSDPAFRSKLKNNPDSAIRDAGIHLSKNEQAALRSVDWSLSDKELKERASKAIPA
jgi:hypothetical protein